MTLAEQLRLIRDDFVSSGPSRSLVGSISRAGTAEASKAIQLAAKAVEGEGWREAALALAIQRAEATDK